MSNMQQKFLVLAILSTSIISCGTKEETTENIESNDNYYSDLEVSQIAPNDDLITSIEFNIISIPHPDSVGKAFSKIVDRELLFFDILRAEVRRISSDFKLEEHSITKGEDPDQVPRIETFATKKTQKIFLSG
ncbi:hypothetical protein ACFCT7_07880 [Fulvivirgaceae bacterium LMO-SS25]